MKTTIDIANNIMVRSKKLSRRQKVTFKALVEEGLELVLEKRTAKGKYKAQPVTFAGAGLSGEYKKASWEKIRELAYGDRGG